MGQSLVHHDAPIAPPSIREVETTRPLVWLQRGAADFRRARTTSLAYGALVAMFGVVLLALAWNATYLVPALIGGFLLVAPFLAMVFYALSRQIERGESIDPVGAFFAWRRNAASIALFGLMLALALITWERLAAIVFALFYGGQVSDIGTLVTDILFSGRYTQLLIAYFGVGGLVAASVFAFSVVTAPLLLDREVDVITAAVTSIRCCLRNPLAMLVWAALIAVLTAVGFATFMIGLLIVFPIIGHATWHAYRDLVA
jgi:uncharacterized membrane protein